MNQDPTKPQHGNRTAGAKSGKPTRRPAVGDNEVGYGKPPVATRFVKGQSGNPRGRPRKQRPTPLRLSDAPSDRFLEEEAYRPVALRENGLPIELPATKAVIRSLMNEAIKGKRLSQKYVLEWLARMEKLYLQYKVQNYVRLETLKREGERAIAEHERRGLPPPDLRPHPEDIVLRPSTGEAYVNGPETEEDLPFYEHGVRLRDHALLVSAHHHQLRKKTTAKPEQGGVCGVLVFAQLLDKSMPKRYRWKEGEDFFLMMEYSSLTKRERERRIEAEWAQLMATKPIYSLITPEMDRELDKLVARLTRSKNTRQHETVTN